MNRRGFFGGVGALLASLFGISKAKAEAKKFNKVCCCNGSSPEECLTHARGCLGKLQWDGGLSFVPVGILEHRIDSDFRSSLRDGRYVTMQVKMECEYVDRIPNSHFWSDIWGNNYVENKFQR